MLGHYSAGFTLDTYTHVTHQMQQGAADKIGGFMVGSGGEHAGAGATGADTRTHQDPRWRVVQGHPVAQAM
jgi:hypothetical protein